MLRDVCSALQDANGGRPVLTSVGHNIGSRRTWQTIEEFESFLDDGGMVEADDDMPDEYRKAVFAFIEMHANSELMGGLTERDWVPKTPGLRHKMAVVAKTQDEIGHAHLLYMIAADMAVKTRDEMIEDLLEGKSRFHNVFHYRAVTWGDQVAIAFLVDAAALASQQAVFKNCSYGPYRRILKRIIAEEGFHMRLGEDRMMRIAKGTELQRTMFQDSLDRWFWPALQLFGPNSKPDDVLLRWHIKSERNEVLRDKWVQKFVPLLQGYGFSIPAPDLRWDEATERWDVGPIDWEPLKATLAQKGPDSARRIGEAKQNWEHSAWVRRALNRQASV